MMGAGRALAAALLLIGVAGAPSARAEQGGPLQAIHREGGDDLAARFRAQIAEVERAGGAVVVMFTADWCTPCRSLKSMLERSDAVRAAVGKGRVLLIDVDEWRGPAHRLIPGQNPDKLPLLVRVDSQGRSVVSCYGTELGLLTEEATAANLARLFRGEAPTTPGYMATPELEREAMREFSARERADAGEGPPAAASVEPGGATLRLMLHNADARRRWFVVPLLPGDRVPDAPVAITVTEMKFDEHVRATWVRVGGDHPFMAVPVAGNGSAELGGVWLPGRLAGATLPVRVVDRLVVDGQPLEFQKKLPYALRIARAGSHPASERRGPLSVALVGGQAVEASVSAAP
ncbi:MAG: thioredoxin family protein [Deltaproteobacteria bacterium]|nr:thioredoxin family protein [Deltaproteobacteria bacterium]